MSESISQVSVNDQPIELCKLLKIANLVAGGGEAKIVISEGYVLLNGEVEFQKRKKVYEGDLVSFNGDTIEVIIDSIKDSVLENKVGDSPAKKAKKKKSKKDKLKPSANANELTNDLPEVNTRKRRPISF